ncbi:hypothetical protein BDN70DRAFT_885253 [Pholiota conissans]|uniref:Uncharacterized protein n=1 Tax=Pholiota conissans TaxID=109636 RepID=A0A9P6CP05_9AGAR|nr:hypothetical protein BDN70DRAFT_885253 [Pholiota conissans]
MPSPSSRVFVHPTTSPSNPNEHCPPTHQCGHPSGLFLSHTHALFASSWTGDTQLGLPTT